MVLFKVTIKPKNSFQTGLKSTTLYGAMCCAIADMSSYGNEVLEDIVFKSNTALVLSDAFPSGYIASPTFKSDSKLSVMNTGTGEIETFGIVTDKQQHCMVSRENNMSIKLREEVISYYDKPLDFYYLAYIFFCKEVCHNVKVKWLVII